MKRKLATTLALVLASSVWVFASSTTITGVLTDDMCTKKHMMPGKANADCVRECIKHGAKYVIVSQGKVFEVKGNQDELSKLAGKKVTVTGELKGKVLSVSSAESVQ